MAWYWIVLIIIAALPVLLFVVYFLNLDMKLVQALYPWLHKHYDNMKRDRQL